MQGGSGPSFVGFAISGAGVQDLEGIKGFGCKDLQSSRLSDVRQNLELRAET